MKPGKESLVQLSHSNAPDSNVMIARAREPEPEVASTIEASIPAKSPSFLTHRITQSLALAATAGAAAWIALSLRRSRRPHQPSIITRSIEKRPS
jgi:hypothetical protein